MGEVTLPFLDSAVLDLAFNVRQSSSMFVNVRQCSSMFVNVRQCTSMYVNVRQCSLRGHSAQFGDRLVIRLGVPLVTVLLDPSPPPSGGGNVTPS